MVRNAPLGVRLWRSVATTAVPDEVVKRVTAGASAVPTGIEHGTVTVVIDKVLSR